MNHLQDLVKLILDSQTPAYALRAEVFDMMEILSASSSVNSTQQENKDISYGESRSPNGLALSPKMAAMCAEDFARTIEFIRGTHEAIVDIRARFPDRPARILYAGCGPFGTIAVPLMSVFTPNEATFTLIDIHSESIESVKSIVNNLGLDDSVEGFEVVDACLYPVNSAKPPDIIVFEVMQACLAAEPQVALTRHFSNQAPGAVLIPEEISIELVLMNPALEFDLESAKDSRDPVTCDRIKIGSVFVLNRKTAESWSDISDDILPGMAVQIPETIDMSYQPMLFTNIRVYKNHVLKDYMSGLTIPVPLSRFVEFKNGDTIQFSYKLGTRPGLAGEIIESAKIEDKTKQLI